MLSGGAHAASSFNAQSPMGINLSGVSYYASEQPFINSFVTSERWIAHSDATWDTKEEKYLNLDADGWPITLTSVNEPTAQQFNSLGVLSSTPLSSAPPKWQAIQNFIAGTPCWWPGCSGMIGAGQTTSAPR
jgi:hypothetical protein